MIMLYKTLSPACLFFFLLFVSCKPSMDKVVQNDFKLPDSVDLSRVDTASIRSIRCDSLESRLNALLAAKTFVSKSNLRNSLLTDYGQTHIVYFYSDDFPENGRCCSFRPYLLRISEPRNEPSFLVSRIHVLKLGLDSIIIKEQRKLE